METTVGQRTGNWFRLAFCGNMERNPAKLTLLDFSKTNLNMGTRDCFERVTRLYSSATAKRGTPPRSLYQCGISDQKKQAGLLDIFRKRDEGLTGLWRFKLSKSLHRCNMNSSAETLLAHKNRNLVNPVTPACLSAAPPPAEVFRLSQGLRLALTLSSTLENPHVTEMSHLVRFDKFICNLGYATRSTVMVRKKMELPDIRLYLFAHQFGFCFSCRRPESRHRLPG